MQETWVRSLGWKDPLEEEMATHSSTLAWKIPWTEGPGKLQSVGLGLKRFRHDWGTSLFTIRCSVHPFWKNLKERLTFHLFGMVWVKASYFEILLVRTVALPWSELGRFCVSQESELGLVYKCRQKLHLQRCSCSFYRWGAGREWHVDGGEVTHLLRNKARARNLFPTLRSDLY